ncbi:lipoxygenase [Trifolium pratense]|uniref:Lipoxygenase n=1 Tax=Trifolium pratense TaxID=57577 RepID=A0A2K3M8N2_TRIPR|nr:lipoxygenase [Trifolium pratense]
MFATLKGLSKRGQKVKGRVVLMHKNVLDINALTTAKSAAGVIKGGVKIANCVAGNILDTATAGLGCSVALRLISATTADGNNFLIFKYF